MTRPLPHEIHEPRGHRLPPVHPEEEASHGEIFDALMDIRERLGRMEQDMRRMK